MGRGDEMKKLPERIDYSRYRMAEAIAELHAAGEGLGSIADIYFKYAVCPGYPPTAFGQYVVELVIAAHDRKDKFAGLPGPEDVQGILVEEER
jgi:hypothetical protein